MSENVDPLVIPWEHRSIPKEWSHEEGFDWLDDPRIVTLEDAINVLDSNKNQMDVKLDYKYVQMACSIISQMEEIMETVNPINFIANVHRLLNGSVVDNCWPNREQVEEYCGVFIVESYGSKKMERVTIDCLLVFDNEEQYRNKSYSYTCSPNKIENIPTSVVDEYFNSKKPKEVYDFIKDPSYPLLLGLVLK